MEAHNQRNLSEIHDSNVTWTLMCVATLLRKAEFGGIDVMSLIGGYVPTLLKHFGTPSLEWKNYVITASTAAKVDANTAQAAQLKIIDDGIGYRRAHNTLTAVV